MGFFFFCLCFDEAIASEAGVVSSPPSARVFSTASSGPCERTEVGPDSSSHERSFPPMGRVELAHTRSSSWHGRRGFQRHARKEDACGPDLKYVARVSLRPKRLRIAESRDGIDVRERIIPR
nr:hypothetical protein CFP56_56006 [Quercus suber]